jgi:hypothetical protein
MLKRKSEKDDPDLFEGLSSSTDDIKTLANLISMISTINQQDRKK